MDALRGTALLAMIVAHSARLAPALAGQESAYRLISAAEPGISATFLFLAGRSLARSRSRAVDGEVGVSARSWYLRCLKRSAVLYLLGVVLFLLQYGPSLPNVLLSPDILSTIAWALAVVGACLWWTSRSLPWAFLLTLAAAAGLELVGNNIVGVNAGPGGTIPLLAFALLGAWYDGFRRPTPWRTETLVAVSVGLCFAGAALPGAVTLEYASHHVAGGVEQRLWFWNHSVRGVLIVAGLLAGASLLVDTLEQRLRRSWARLLRLVGRHALAGYVGHLSVLGVVKHLSVPLSGVGTLFLLAGALFCLVCAVALVLELRGMVHLRTWIHRCFGVAL
jgi:hypothetical protein